MSDGLSCLPLLETKIAMKNVFIGNRDEDNAISILHKFISIRGDFDKKEHSSLLEMKNSWLRFHNNASLLDDLKEWNLGTNKEPRPTYVTSSLTPKEEK